MFTCSCKYKRSSLTVDCNLTYYLACTLEEQQRARKRPLVVKKMTTVAEVEMILLNFIP